MDERTLKALQELAYASNLLLISPTKDHPHLFFQLDEALEAIKAAQRAVASLVGKEDDDE